MKLQKYHLGFIVFNVFLTAAINRTLGGDWMFRMFLLLWLVSVALCVLGLQYIFSRLFKSWKPIFLLLAVYLSAFIIANLFIASFDPNQVGWLNNLVNTFKDSGTLYLIILPFTASAAISCIWCAFGTRISAAFSRSNQKQPA